MMASGRSDADVQQALVDLMMIMAENSKHLSLKILHYDNLVDRLLFLIGQRNQIAHACSELLANLLIACGSEQMRSKFALTLQGIERLI